MIRFKTFKNMLKILELQRIVLLDNNSHKAILSWANRLKKEWNLQFKQWDRRYYKIDLIVWSKTIKKIITLSLIKMEKKRTIIVHLSTILYSQWIIQGSTSFNNFNSLSVIIGKFLIKIVSRLVKLIMNQVMMLRAIMNTYQRHFQIRYTKLRVFLGYQLSQLWEISKDKANPQPTYPLKHLAF